MDQSLSTILVVFIFATLAESNIENVFGGVEAIKPHTTILSLIISIALCFIYQVDIFVLLLNLQFSPFLDFLFSGFIIARVSTYLNMLVVKIFG